jgi:diguanylate cyclase (GGDEF)-like protein
MSNGILSLIYISNDLDFFEEIKEIAVDNDLKAVECRRVFPPSKVIRDVISNRCDLAILDVPEKVDNLKTIEKLAILRPHLPIIVIVQSGAKRSTGLIHAGAVDVIQKSHLDRALLREKILSEIERGRAAEMVKMRDDILQAVTSAAESLLLNVEWESLIEEVLRQLGVATGSDRVYIFKNDGPPRENLEISLKGEWVAKGMLSNKELINDDPCTYEDLGYSRWSDMLASGQLLHGEVEELPSTEQENLRRAGVKSFIIAPIFVDQEWWGFIGFDQCRRARSWESVQIDALKTASSIFGAALSRQNAEKKLVFLATHDYLTKLPNRHLFEDRFQLAASRSDRSGEKIAVISLDLDKFKSVNDTYGHPVGDIVLVETGRRLSEALRSSDTCARIGGDEFGIIAETIHNKGDVTKVLEKLTRAFESPVKIDGINISISVSMGASLYPDQGKDLESIMKAADRALYEVKDKQINYKIFKDSQFPLPESQKNL